MNTVTEHGLSEPQLSIQTDADTWTLHLPDLLAGYYDALQNPAFLHISTALRLSGAVDAGRLEWSFRQFTRRHRVLRSRFVIDADGRRCALIDDRLEALFRTEELNGHNVEDTDAALARLEKFVAERFDLANGPLARMLLLKVSAGDFLMVLVVHHCVFDWWSGGIALREILSLYETNDASSAASLPALPLQFPEFARSRNRWQESPSASAQLAYWRRRFTGADKPFFLPTDEPELAEPTGNELPVAGNLSVEMSAALRDLATQERTGLFITTLTAFALALAQWRGHPESYICVTRNGRTRAPLMNLVGCFFDTWTLRAPWPQRCSFRDAVRIVRDAYTEALPNFDVPSQLQMETLSAAAGTLYGATLFNYVNTGKRPATGKPTSPSLRFPSGLRISPFPRLARTPHMEPSVGTVLTINVVESGDAVEWWLQHNPAKFRASTIEKFSAATARLLAQGATEADAPIDGI